MNFIERLSNGWSIAMNSFKVLKENKQLLIFPVLSGFSLLLIIGSFFTASLAAAGWNLDNMHIGDEQSVAYYLILFAFYVVNYFIVIFFNMALIHCTRLYFHGEKATVQEGLKFSLTRAGSIFAWSFVAATVGLVLRIIQENVGSLGKIITGLVGMVWSIATFFVIPVIAYENAGPLDAFKRSSQLMKEKWGQSLGANFSFGLIQLIGILILGVPLFFLGGLFDPLVGITLAIMGAFLVISVISAARTIFVSAVYHNITGDPVEHYNQQLVDNLFAAK